MQRCAAAIEKARWGTDDIGLTTIDRRSGFLSLTAARDAPVLRDGMPRYDRLKADVSPLPCKRSIRNLHHQRSVRRVRRRNQSAKQILSRRSQRRAAIANPFRWFALPSVSGLRLVPSGRPRALGRAHSCASPGIRVSRSGLRRENEQIFSSRQQKTLRSLLAREGPCERTCRCRLREIAPMSRAGAIDRLAAVRQSCGIFQKSGLHHLAHVCSRTRCSREAADINLVLANVNMKN